MGTLRSTVVVVTWRGRAHVANCLDAVAAQDRPHRILVVDNASADGTAELLARHPSRPEVLRMSRNRGYAGGIAAALAQVSTPFVAWLNDDAVPEPGWLAALEDALDADSGAWAAASVLRAPDGAVQSVGVRLTADGHGADLAEVTGGRVGGAHRCDAARDGSGAARTGAAETGEKGILEAGTDAGGPGETGLGASASELGETGSGAAFEVFGFCGGAALLRTERVRAVGGVPANFFCYYEDTDTSWRLRLAGGRVVSVPAARVTHLHGASSRLGSPRFHRWNELNRLRTLLRCAPAPIATRELLRFAAVTCALPLRSASHRLSRAGLRALPARSRARRAPPLPRTPPNFRVALRLRVLAEVAATAPAALRARRAHGSAAARHAVWSRWSGEHPPPGSGRTDRWSE